MQRIVAGIMGLRQHPYIAPRGEQPGTRMLVIEGHVIIYEVAPDTGRSATAGDVTVLRVFGPGQSRET